MIEVTHVSKKYGKKQILNDITFHAAPGECVAIVGRNGCGKSTLLSVLAGVAKQDSGDVSFFGESRLEKRRRFCGYLPQENPLMEELSVRDNLRLWEGPHRDAFSFAVEQFQLEGILKQKVSTLSGGMKRRLSIACALMKMPSVMIMDEPTSALDLYYKESIHDWIGQYLRANGTIVMATHDESEIAKASRCLFMEGGVLRETDKTKIRQEMR